MELSFVDVDDVIDLNERLLKKIFMEILGKEIKTPFLRLSYKEAMERFGSDKPDLRFDLEIKNLSEIVKSSGFKIFD